VLCIDLDGFKAVNDLHGHPAGDELLIEVAHRLRTVVRGNELVARLGGDEFAIVQEGGSQPTHAGLLSERLIDALREPFSVGSQSVRISASIGVAIYPDDAETPSDLIKNADMALYRAKAEGRGFTRFYEAAMDEALRQRRQLEADLTKAIGREELKVHYQPLADLGSGGDHRIRGAAALGPCAARPDQPGNVHPSRRGERAYRQARRMGAARSLPRGRALGSAAEARGQPFAAPVHPGGSGRRGRGRARRDRARSIAARAGGDRRAADQGHERRPRHARTAEGARRPDRDGRFRHRLFVVTYLRMFPFDKVKIDQASCAT